MKFTSMGLSEDLINTMEAVLAMEGEYEVFFKAALKKFGVNTPADFKSDEEKKKFFDYVDKNYKGEKEEEVKEANLSEKAKIILKDKEMKDVQKVVSRAVGKNVDFRMSDSDYNTGAIDFGGLGKYNIFVGSQDNDGKMPYEVSVEDEDGDYIAGYTANDYKSMLKLVTKLAKKHKNGLIKEEEVEEGKAKPVKKFLKLGDCSYDKKKKVKEDNSQGMEDFVEYKYKSASLNKIKQDLKKLMKRESEFKDSQKYGKMLMKAMDNVTLVNDDGIPHMTPKFNKEIVAAYNGDTMFREDVASIIIKHDDNLAYAIFGV
jgi:hypothetical protein